MVVTTCVFFWCSMVDVKLVVVMGLTMGMNIFAFIVQIGYYGDEGDAVCLYARLNSLRVSENV